MPKHKKIKRWNSKKYDTIIDVRSPSEFEIDSKANRVCTYLRAFSDGTINRKFAPLSKRIVFVLDESGSMSGSKANQAVNSIIQLFDSHVQIGDVSGCTVLHFYIEGYIFIDCNF